MKRRMASAREYRNTNANSHPHVVGGYGNTVPVEERRGADEEGGAEGGEGTEEEGWGERRGGNERR
jgi:hypothetical protein